MIREGRSQAASVALVVAAALGGALAAPARAAAPAPLPGARRVAVLNAADDVAAGARAAARVRRVLVREPQLTPLQPGELSRALEGALPDRAGEDRALAEAAEHLEAARRALAEFDPLGARRALGRAETALLSVGPAPRALAGLARVAFQGGLVHLREQNRGLAIDSFRLVHRLEPERPALDPARYPPEVVSAFEAARGSAGAPARLEVSSTFDGVPVFLDGAEVGQTPLALEVAAGPHLIAVVAPGHAPESVRLDAAPRDQIQLVLDLRRLPASEQVIELRRQLAGERAGGADRRARLRDAARQVAALAGVEAVVVISTGAAGTEASIYQQRGDRLSLARPVAGELAGLLAILVPAPPPGPSDLLFDPGRPAAVPWYQQPWGVASIGGGALAAIVIAAVVAASGGAEPLPRTLPAGGVGFDQ